MPGTIIFGTRVTIRVLKLVQNIHKLNVAIWGVIFYPITTKRKVGKANKQEHNYKDFVEMDTIIQ